MLVMFHEGAHDGLLPRQHVIKRNCMLAHPLVKHDDCVQAPQVCMPFQVRFLCCTLADIWPRCFEGA